MGSTGVKTFQIATKCFVNLKNLELFSVFPKEIDSYLEPV